MAAETGIPAVDTVLVWGGAVSLTLGLVTIAWRGIRGGVRLGRRVDQFIDDWQGEPSRAGVPARPGVMERMGGLEDRMGGVEADLQRIKHELYPNSGGSLRDAVDRANERLALLCPGTVVPGGDARGDRRPVPGDTEQDNPGDGPTAPGDTSDLTSGDTRDSAGDSHEGG
ncbi:hypothetical protein G6541_06370 [Streptomyces albidoflavus]|nr:hypothetical protein [Streptomyces albidoflavus]